MSETATATITGPQLEVIALLADGQDINAIAAITGGTQASVNGHIRDACLALGANDRIHLIAVAYRAGLLHVPARPALVEELRAQLDAANTQLQADARDRDAWKSKYDQLMARVGVDNAIATVPPAEVEQLRRDLAEARNAAADALESKAIADRKAATAREERNAATAARGAMERARDQVQGMYERTVSLYREAQARADRAEAAAGKAALTPQQLRAAAGPWDFAIAHLQQLAVETRNAAQRGGLAMLQTAKGVDLAIARLEQAARR